MITIRRAAHVTRAYASPLLIAALTSAVHLTLGPVPFVSVQMAIASTTSRAYGILSKLGLTDTRV